MTLQAEVNHCQRDKMSETAMLAVKKPFDSKGKSKGKGKLGPRPDNECRHCHEKGHWISKCPKCEAKEKKTGAGTASLAVNNLQNLGSESSGLGYTEWVFMAGLIPDRGKLLLDLAAMPHMLSITRYSCPTLQLHSIPPMTLSPSVTPGMFQSLDIVLLSLRHSYRIVITRLPSAMPSMSQN